MPAFRGRKTPVPPALLGRKTPVPHDFWPEGSRKIACIPGPPAAQCVEFLVLWFGFNLDFGC